MSLAMSTALSAMMVSQRLAEIASHNIANANTPGYSRQEGVLRPSLPVNTTAGVMGTGVTIDRIVAIRDDFLNVRIGQQKSGLGMAESQARILAELETIIMPSPDSGLGNAIDTFFSAVNELANSPQSDVARESLRQNAITLSDTFRSTDSQLRQLHAHVKAEFDQTVGAVNSLLSEIGDLNGRIMASADGSNTANDLVDQRNLMLENLSRLVPVQVTNEAGVANVLLEGRLVVSGTSYMLLQSDTSSGRLRLSIAGAGDSFDCASGVAGGQAKLYNEIIPEYIGYVDSIAAGLIQSFNTVHSTGVGLTNGYTSLTSATELSDLDLNGIRGDEPLSMHNMQFPAQAGLLWITVTNDATGEIHRASIGYDPNVDSVASLAERIAGVPYMNASTSSGFLTITAWPGFRFDFSNRITPDGGSLGASAVTVSGAYTGSSDRSYTFYPMSSGTVGQTADLRVAVVDSDGKSLGLLQVGSGYTPGTPLAVADGVMVSFGAGTVQAAQVESAGGPFELADGDVLQISLNGGEPVTITFSADDFTDITAATASEVAYAINSAGGGVKAAVVDGKVVIFSESTGAGRTIEVSGDAAAKLGVASGVVSTDSNTISVTGQTDTGGLLPALMINPFFTGTGAGNIDLSAHIRADIRNLAAAKTSPPGDNANAVKMAQIKYQRVVGGNTQTLNEFFAGVVGKAGIAAQQAMRSQETQSKLVENLELQRDSVAGVSLEEEMARLMQTQQAYYAAVRLLTAVDEMLKSLASL
ncbi:MAG TPA: flagellar hook-associated protein FlgK [Planctomycetota bacterium]|nr:flagellar hook-associated protein FlgK [Planctomycetota bacterium]